MKPFKLKTIVKGLKIGVVIENILVVITSNLINSLCTYLLAKKEKGFRYSVMKNV